MFEFCGEISDQLGCRLSQQIPISFHRLGASINSSTALDNKLPTRRLACGEFTSDSQAARAADGEHFKMLIYF